MTCCNQCSYGRAVNAAVAGYASAPRVLGSVRFDGLPPPARRVGSHGLPDDVREQVAGRVAEMSADDMAAVEAVSHAMTRIAAERDPRRRVEVFRRNPWLVEVVSGVTKREETPETVGDALDVVRQVDDVFSTVWDAAKEAVPYGKQIDTLHRARRDALDRYVYKRPTDAERARATLPAPAPALDKRETVKEMQGLHRAKLRGDESARARVIALKEGAERDATARRRWHVYVAVARDDLKRMGAL